MFWLIFNFVLGVSRFFFYSFFSPLFCFYKTSYVDVKSFYFLLIIFMFIVVALHFSLFFFSLVNKNKIIEVECASIVENEFRACATKIILKTWTVFLFFLFVFNPLELALTCNIDVINISFIFVLNIIWTQ